MKTIAERLSATFTAATAGSVILGAALFLLADPSAELAKARQRLAGGAGVAERYRAMQATANAILLAAPRAGVTDLRALPDLAAALQ